MTGERRRHTAPQIQSTMMRKMRIVMMTVMGVMVTQMNQMTELGMQLLLQQSARMMSTFTGHVIPGRRAPGVDEEIPNDK